MPNPANVLPTPAILQAAAKSYQIKTLSLLRALVESESPSHNKAAVDSCAAIAADEAISLGATLKWHRQRHFGDILEARFLPSGAPQPAQEPILLLGHLDTVWPLGTLKTMPYRHKYRRIHGPGTLDMKAGVAMAFTAIRILEEIHALSTPAILLLNSDEEIGSPVSRPITEKLAAQSRAVFVLEPAQNPTAAYKTARKGIANYTLRIKGVAAHAGVDFQAGHSAILELAHQLPIIAAFTNLDRGITVNPGVVSGGTQSNVVAAQATAEIDVRYPKGSDARKIERLFNSLRPIDKECVLEITGGQNRPPMERTPSTVKLFRRAATFARQLGIHLTEASTGGGSDGNFTSALGVPTLDGMGAVGEGAHAAHESILLEHIAPRTALLASMLVSQIEYPGKLKLEV